MIARTSPEGAAIPFAVSIFTDTTEPWVPVVPTTLRYRIDDLDSGCVILDWTTVTPAVTATIIATGAQGTLIGCRDARRQLVVEADHGLSTNCMASRQWMVRNLAGVT